MNIFICLRLDDETGAEKSGLYDKLENELLIVHQRIL
jgi:hypothetical protein